MYVLGANPMLKDDEDLNAIHYAVKYKSCLEELLDTIKKNDVPCDLNEYNNGNIYFVYVNLLLRKFFKCLFCF